MFIKAGMLAEILESIENRQNLLKIQANTMETQDLLMRRMLAEMLESIGNFQNRMKIQVNTMEKQGVLMWGCWRKCWKALKIFKLD